LDRHHKTGLLMHYDLSDGTLRALALFTVHWDNRGIVVRGLSRSMSRNLGLHPAALHLFCALCRSVSSDSQIFLATQSLFLLDSFDLSQIIVAEQHQGETRFKTLSQDDLQIWLDDYSLSEIFEKHIIGGYP
jgi:predicted ATPase